MQELTQKSSKIRAKNVSQSGTCQHTGQRVPLSNSLPLMQKHRPCLEGTGCTASIRLHARGRTRIANGAHRKQMEGKSER